MPSKDLELRITARNLATRAMRTIQKDLVSLSKTMKRVGRTMQQAGRNMTLAFTVPLGLLAAAVIGFGGSFNKAMTESLAIMGNVSAEMRKVMEDTAREISKVSTFSATQVAEAYFFLASAGLTATQAIGAIPLVTKFAQAGMFNLARATELLAGSQAALGLTVKNDIVKNMENMLRVSDVLVKANVLSQATTEEFALALANKAAASLRLSRVEMETGVAVLAVFAKQNLKGAAAGERLSIVLRELQVRGFQNRHEFKKLGITIFDSGGEMRNMADIIKDMEKALLPMSVETRRATLMQLGFQLRSVDAIAALLGFSEEIRSFEKRLKEAGGTTEEVAQKQLKSFNAQVGILKSKLVDVGLTLAEVLLPILIELMNELDPYIKLLKTWAEKFKSLNIETQKLIIGIAAVAAILGPLLVVLGILVTTVGTLVGAFAALVTVVVALASPLIIITAGLLGIAYLLGKVGKEADITTKSVKAMTDDLEYYMDPVALAMMDASGATQDLDKDVQHLKDGLKGNGVGEYIKDFFKDLVIPKGMFKLPDEVEASLKQLNELKKKYLDEADADAATSALKKSGTFKMNTVKELEAAKWVEGQRIQGLENLTTRTVEQEDLLHELKVERLQAEFDQRVEILGMTEELQEAHYLRMQELENEHYLVRLEAQDTFTAGVEAGFARWAESVQTIAKVTSDLTQSLLNTFSKGVGKAFADTIVYGKKLGEGLKSLMKSVAATIITTLIQIGVQRMIQAVIGKGILMTEASARMAVLAAETYAGAFAATAVIPVTGPGLAPGVAALAMSTMLAGATASAAGGASVGAGIAGIAHGGLGDVPREGTYLLDKGERVLAPGQNKDLTSFLDDIGSDEGGVSRGGDVYNINFNITAFDGEDVERVTKGQIIPILRDDIRDFGVMHEAIEEV